MHSKFGGQTDISALEKIAKLAAYSGKYLNLVTTLLWGSVWPHKLLSFNFYHA